MIGGKAELDGARRALEGRDNDRLAHDVHRVPGFGARRVLVHQPGQEVLVEAPPVDADAHRFVPAQCGFDHLAKLAVFFVALANVARVDAVLGERLCAVGIVGQQTVAVEVKVANQGHSNAHAIELFTDVRHSLRRLRRVHRVGDWHHCGGWRGCDRRVQILPDPRGLGTLPNRGL